MTEYTGCWRGYRKECRLFISVQTVLEHGEGDEVLYHKKSIAVLLMLTVFSLSACGGDGGLLTDTAGGKKQELPKEEYLKQDIVPQETTDLYQTYILSKGTYTEKIKEKKLGIWTGNLPVVRYDLKGITGKFGGYTLDPYFQVNKGDAIATVFIDADRSEVQKAQITVQRLEERYRQAEVQTEEDLQEILEEKALIYNDYKRWIMDVRYRQRQQDWELEKYNYENRIQDAREELQKLTALHNQYTICAPADGVVAYGYAEHFRKNVGMTSVMEVETGKELKEGDPICMIMTENPVFQYSRKIIPFGMEKELSSGGEVISARVVSAGPDALYGNLDLGVSVLRVDNNTTHSAAMEALLMDGTVSTVENVILVPGAAVTVEEQNYYVTVLKEDGSLQKTQFLPGGNSEGTYWVLEGLSEGMQIVY